ncbi:A disintegrin and metalloproteinase with thrombospondin motifs adt-1-like isoform X2 [Hydra vulgaris]|uniref:A disintegrin and metalloproteinase with thrombospondin motifs adt-1-like isoform X2 n=1 Tax=Hydra vulgaris TaxID=6087 RepID=A0ABM4CNN1_HYDVU
MKYSYGFFLIFLFAISKVQGQTYTQWTPFSDCSATCNTGSSIRTRTRTCTPSSLCLNAVLTDTISCNLQYPCPDYKLGDWGPWSTCSESCRATQSNPTRVRTRSYCLDNSTATYQCTSNFMVSYEPCNTAACSIVKSCNSINFTYVFLMDVSSSIDSEEWTNEKNLVKGFVDGSSFEVNQNVDVSVVTFSSEAIITLPCDKFTTKNEFRNFMDNLVLRGGATAINRGLLKAQEAYQSCPKSNIYPVVILLTDGKENVDEINNTRFLTETKLKSEALLVAGAVRDYNKDEIDRITTQGRWTSWTSWSACSQVCGATGTMQRSRSCVNPVSSKNQEDCEPDVDGANYSFKTCFMPCTTFSDWTSWSACSASCRLDSGPPISSRSRTCLPGLGSCIGSLSETQECNTNVPCQGIMSSWEAWGQCSATCQLTSVLPTQLRSRTCVGATLGGNCDGQSTVDSQTCIVGINCTGTLSGWSAWSSCSASCNTQVNGPYQYRSQVCVGASTWNPNYVGCNGASLNDQQLCNQNVPCSGNYGVWGAWGACSETCQSNPALTPYQTQTRQCFGATLNGSCPGANYQTQPCNSAVSCPGTLSDWGSWEACSASCQMSFIAPTQTKRRVCSGNTFNGNCNGAVLFETQNCNEQVVCQGTISDWSSWGTCSANCNNLVSLPYQNRTRSCSGYSTWNPIFKGCSGITTSEQQSCNTNTPCQGTYGVWSAWGGCSETCQSNQNTPPFQTQTRQCIGATLGGGCVGSSNQTQSCNMQVPCPGVLSDWTAWGDCSASCQYDLNVPQQTSSRICSGSSFGGNCNGAVLIKFKNCKAEVICPGTLSGWGAWSECSATCNSLVNGPYQYRSQSCNGVSTWKPNVVGCNGVSLNDQQLCNQLVPCPGFYTAWSEWSSCSESCQSNINNSPTQFHTRTCQNFTLNGGCVGVSTETQSCNFQVSCPGDLTQWSGFSACSQSCQTGSVAPTMNRVRSCLNPTFGGNCQGQSLTDVQPCNAGVACPGQLTDWTSWSQCPATCQQTVGQYNLQYRSRQCVNASLNGNCGGALLNDQTPCVKDVACPGILSQWSSWSLCSESCRSNLLIAPSQTRTRTCTTATLGANCDGALLVDSLSCNANVGCPGVWTSWGPFTDCSASCQSTGNIVPTQSRQRFCVNNTLDGACLSDNNGGKTQTVQCNVGVICSVKGTWGAWGDWSTCSASCDAGIIQRSRACSAPYPIGAGDDCIGNTTQTLPCKLFDCPKSCAIAKRCNCSQVKQWSSVPMFDEFQSRGLTLRAIETVLGYLSSYGDDTVDKACQACNTMMLTTLRSNVVDQLSQAKAARAKLELIKIDLRDVIYCNGVILNNAGLWNLYDSLYERATMLDGVIIELNAIYLRFDAALTSCQSYGWIHQTFKTILRKCTF